MKDTGVKGILPPYHYDPDNRFQEIRFRSTFAVQNYGLLLAYLDYVRYYDNGDYYYGDIVDKIIFSYIHIKETEYEEKLRNFRIIK